MTLHHGTVPLRRQSQPHPNHHLLRIYVASGQINGHPVPVPALKHYDLPEVSNDKYRLGALKGWEKRRERV